MSSHNIRARKTERMITLMRLQTILSYMAWDKLQLKHLAALRDEVDQEIEKLKREGYQ